MIDMNKIKERRRMGAICKVCKSPDYCYEGISEFGKHTFICKSCGHSWMYGKTGSKYTKLL